MNVSVVDRSIKTVEMNNTVTTRKYPFTQETLDQIQDLRHAAEERWFDENGEEVIIPAPIVIADAVNNLHKQTFSEI